MVAKSKPAKRDAARCRWYHESYGSPKTADCPNSKAPKKELCAEHEAAWRVIAKKRAAVRKAETATAAAKPEKVVPLDPMTRGRAVPKVRREPIGRVAAMVAPEVIVTETT